MQDSSPSADRAISELIGMVLLIGLVLLGSTTIVVLGAGALSDAQEQTQTEAAEDQLQQLDSKLSTLAAADGLPRAEFDASTSVARDYRIEREGSVNVTVNRNASCSFEQAFSTVVHEDSQGRTVGYEAGGVWRAGIDGSTTLTPPDVTFQDGTLDISLVNLSGTVDQTTNVAQLNVTRTQNRSQHVADALTQGQCVRPDNLTVWVNSSFQRGWANYLSSEIGVPDSHVDSFSNGSVRVVVPQDYLHPSVDDRTNNVINLKDGRSGTDIPYMHNVELVDPGPPASIMVNKTAGNTYSTYVQPLTDDSLDIGHQINVDATNISGPPRDVSVILDESGSMRFKADGSGDCGLSWYPSISAWYYDMCPNSKSEAAIDAAKDFVGTLNASRDRVGLVGYNASGYYHPTNERYYSPSFTAVNNTLENDINAFGGTRIDRGLEDSNAMFDLRSNETRAKFVILLTDGENDCSSPPCNADEATVDAAERAAKNDITIYTVGYGADSFINQTLLRTVANRTGGKYYQATNASKLREAFKDIGKRISPMNAIASTPMTSNITASGQLFEADIPGNTSHIAHVNVGNHTFANINDPTAPALFSHSFPLQDGEKAEFNLSTYSCGTFNLTGKTKQVSGTTMAVARCTDITGHNETLPGRITLDGERPDRLLSTTYASWQDDVNASLDAFPSVDINATTGELEAESNQALVVFDLPPQGPGTRNTLALLVQTGLSEQDAVGEDIVRVRVAEAELS